MTQKRQKRVPRARFTSPRRDTKTNQLDLYTNKCPSGVLIEQGHLPSYGRQIQHENELKAMRDSAESEVDATPKE